METIGLIAIAFIFAVPIALAINKQSNKVRARKLAKTPQLALTA